MQEDWTAQFGIHWRVELIPFIKIKTAKILEILNFLFAMALSECLYV